MPGPCRCRAVKVGVKSCQDHGLASHRVKCFAVPSIILQLVLHIALPFEEKSSSLAAVAGILWLPGEANDVIDCEREKRVRWRDDGRIARCCFVRTLV